MARRLAVLLVVLSAVGCAPEEATKVATSAEDKKEGERVIAKNWPFDAEEAKRRQEQDAKELGVPVELTDSIGMKLVLIPAGEFVMGGGVSASEVARQVGGRPEFYENELPHHRVKITKPFYLGMYEVTQAEYEAIMQHNPSRFKGRDNSSVENVRWEDAVEFCRRLSEKDEKEYRLPTEAEWEYACRAGAASQYPSGNDHDRLDEYAWYSDKTGTGPALVGQLKPNAWGLYDMHGNADEWCSDWYGEDYYSGRPNPDKDPEGPETGGERVMRGGGKNSCFARSCRSANRYGGDPAKKVAYHGFRVVCEVKP